MKTLNALGIRAALRVARKDISIFLKERGTLLYLFVVPIVFIVGFSAVSSVQGEPREKAVVLPVVNLDAGSEASSALLDALNRGGGIQCELHDEARAKALLERERIKRVLTIPSNYAADLQSGQPVALRLVNGPGASVTRSEAVHRVVTGVAADLSLQTQLIASFRQMADMEAAASPDQQAFTAEIIVEQAQSQFERSRTEPLLGVEESWPQHLLERDEDSVNPLTVNVPGFLVLFVFLTAQTTAQAIYEEKEVGSFRRLLAAPISKATILVGKMIPNFVTGLAQVVVLLCAGALLSPALGLGRLVLGNDPLALILVCLVILLCSTSLGVLIAATARTRDQISGLSQVALWTFGFAGIMLDRIPLPSPFDTVSRLIPHYWANMAFQDLFVRGQGLADITSSLLALLGFTVAFFAVGLWRFRFD
jgi:ABC-2 type transport system permease protein